jgi:hypothetical protein
VTLRTQLGGQRRVDLRRALQEIYDEGSRSYTGMAQLGGTPKSVLRSRGQRMLNIAARALRDDGEEVDSDG